LVDWYYRNPFEFVFITGFFGIRVDIIPVVISRNPLKKITPVCISLKNTFSCRMNPCSLIDVYRRFRRNVYRTARSHISECSCRRIHEHENFNSHIRIFSPHFEHAGAARRFLVPYSSVSCVSFVFLPQVTASCTCVGGYFMVQYVFRYTRTHFSYTAELHLC
jgi:hypothetical protein